MRKVIYIINKKGEIKEWILNLPEGYYICDGTYGTPDLRNTDPRLPKYNSESGS